MQCSLIMTSSLLTDPLCLGLFIAPASVIISWSSSINQLILIPLILVSMISQCTSEREHWLRVFSQLQANRFQLKLLKFLVSVSINWESLYEARRVISEHATNALPVGNAPLQWARLYRQAGLTWVWHTWVQAYYKHIFWAETNFHTWVQA